MAARGDGCLSFYRDVLGLREHEPHDANGGHVTILDAGRATVEIDDPPHAEYIDDVEVGTRVAGHIHSARGPGWAAVDAVRSGGGDRAGQRFASAVPGWSTTAWGSAAPSR